MIIGRDIIIVGIQSWDIEIVSNCKNIALEFSKHDRVLYVKPPLDRITRFKQRDNPKVKKRIQISKGQLPEIELIKNNLWNHSPKSLIESINWIKNHNLYEYFNKRNFKKKASIISSAIQSLGFEKYLLFNGSSMFFGLHLKELLEPNLYMYCIRANLIKVPYWQRQGERIQPKLKLIERTDVITNNLEYFVEYTSKFNTNTHMFEQGCDVSMFSDSDNQIPIPKEFSELKGPIIGYVGSLTAFRLDTKLIENIVLNRRDRNIVNDIYHAMVLTLKKLRHLLFILTMGRFFYRFIRRYEYGKTVYCSFCGQYKRN